MANFLLFASLAFSILVNKSLAWAVGIDNSARENAWLERDEKRSLSSRDAFIDNLVSKLSVEELAQQLHLLFADDALRTFDEAVGNRGIGIIHDWYGGINKSRYNELQGAAIKASRHKIPLLQIGECLHGVGSMKQSMFPQQLGMAATFDPDMVYRVARAIGSEAASIGVRACLSPVLDLAKDPRWGRAQEDFGEDSYLTSILGTEYAKGLSKNSSWNEHDAVIPVVKHFAAHGSPKSGLNAASFVGYGKRQVLSELLLPFKTAIQLGGARGVMMAYQDTDGVPATVDPDFYNALDEWGFDGFVIADDTAIVELTSRHFVAPDEASAISQWLNAGGEVQYYDYPLETWRSVIKDIISNDTVSLSTLQKRVKGVLKAKYDLGLFDRPFIADNVDPTALVNQHQQLALEAARRTIVLIENKNNTLPLQPAKQGISKIALVGPFADTLNFGDYSGPYGCSPGERAVTLRQAMVKSLENSSIDIATAWGSDSWMYRGQYPIPAYLLSNPNGTTGGLQAHYFNDPNFTQFAATQNLELPNKDWGLYPPPGLSSSNFSVIWEGSFEVPSDADGFLGIATSANTTAKLYVNDQLHLDSPFSSTSTILSNIPKLEYIQENGTALPPASKKFSFTAGSKHKIKIEFQVYVLDKKYANIDSADAQIQLFWNLVPLTDPVEKAKTAAKDADIIVFAGGSAWNSDGESGDRATLGLSPNQTQLLDSLFQLGKPLVLVLYGARPFAIPEYYAKASAVLNTYFGGQAGGQAIADVLLGEYNPGGRIPLSIPAHVGQVPTFYDYKFTAHAVDYRDVLSYPSYSFGYGLSYTTFAYSKFHVSTSSSKGNSYFSAQDTINFHFTVENNGTIAGSVVPQVYLLQRWSSVVQPTKKLVGFHRVDIPAGKTQEVALTLDPNRFLLTLTREWKWEVEKGNYTFALLEDSRHDADTSRNATLFCVG